MIHGDTVLDRLRVIDASKHLSLMLTNERDLVMSIFDDEYLSGFFREEPSDIRASKSKKAKFEFDGRTCYVESKRRMILDRLLDRVYLLRCQIVHVAATCGGNLNRDSLLRCIKVMQAVMIAVQLVLIDHSDQDD